MELRNIEFYETNLQEYGFEIEEVVNLVAQNISFAEMSFTKTASEYMMIKSALSSGTIEQVRIVLHPSRDFCSCIFNDQDILTYKNLTIISD